MRLFIDANDDDDETDTSEIDEYRKLKVKNVDLLDWWETKKESLPRLYSVARFIHSIPASSVASERMFSLAGRVVSVRPNMRSELLDEILFLKSNFDIFQAHVSETNVEIDDDDVIINNDIDLNVGNVDK